jgi:hypothetical protein
MAEENRPNVIQSLREASFPAQVCTTCNRQLGMFHDCARPPAPVPAPVVCRGCKRSCPQMIQQQQRQFPLCPDCATYVTMTKTYNTERECQAALAQANREIAALKTKLERYEFWLAQINYRADSIKMAQVLEDEEQFEIERRRGSARTDGRHHD